MVHLATLHTGMMIHPGYQNDDRNLNIKRILDELRHAPMHARNQQCC